MARAAHRLSFLLIGTMTLALSACGGPDPDPNAAAVDSPTAPVANGGDTQSPDAWSEQAQQSAAASTPEDIAAEGVAAGRAMAETCGFTDAEMRQLKSQENAAQQSAGFEARVEAHVPRLRQAQQAQQRENSAAYQESCDLMRFMMGNRG
ncbi:MAG: hypothetical protein ACTIJY_08215 [Luteimonas sp.]